MLSRVRVSQPNEKAALKVIDDTLDAVIYHHAQKADDRCIFDDDKLYAAAGLPPCDRRVGDKFAMAKNCFRFIDRRCEGGRWPTYVELEQQRDWLLQLCRQATADRQCADRCDGPHSDCPCWYCTARTILDSIAAGKPLIPLRDVP